MKENAKIIIIIDSTKNTENLEELLKTIDDTFIDKKIIVCTKVDLIKDIKSAVEIRTPEFLNHINHIRT